MEKTTKMESILNDFTTKAFGRSRNSACCVTCGSDKIYYDDFKDDLSRKEFRISRMCQKCQDSVFEVDNDNQE